MSVPPKGLTVLAIAVDCKSPIRAATACFGLHGSDKSVRQGTLLLRTEPFEMPAS